MAALAAAPTPAHPSSGRLSDADEPSASAGPFAPLFTAGTEPYALAPLDELGADEDARDRGDGDRFKVHDGSCRFTG